MRAAAPTTGTKTSLSHQGGVGCLGTAAPPRCHACSCSLGPPPSLLFFPPPVFYGGQIFPTKDFFDLAHKKKIKPIKGVQVESLGGPNTVNTTGGHSINADLVIWATGYTKSYDWCALERRTPRSVVLLLEGAAAAAAAAAGGGRAHPPLPSALQLSAAAHPDRGRPCRQSPTVVVVQPTAYLLLLLPPETACVVINEALPAAARPSQAGRRDEEPPRPPERRPLATCTATCCPWACLALPSSAPRVRRGGARELRTHACY